MPRQLPPTAVPMSISDLGRGLSPADQAGPLFEKDLAHYLGVPACKLASSGRTALLLLLNSLRQAADHPARREVVMPAYTCPALAKVALDAQLRPRLVDISPHSLCFRDDQLAASLSQQTLAVILVHPFGIPQPTEPVRALAHAAGALLIEDAAQALGARLGGQPVGAGGDFGLFSLGPGKPLSTGGGGAVCARNHAQAQLLEEAWRALPVPSAAVSGWTLIRLALFSLAFHPTGWWLATRIGLHRVGEQEASWGYTLRGLSRAQAAVGSAMLERLDTINTRRQENAGRLIDCLRAFDFVRIPPPAPTAEPISLRLPLLVENGERRERLFQRLWGAGIGVGRMYQHPLPHYFPHLADDGTFPGAEHVAQHLLTLPTHHYLSAEDVERIATIFEEVATPRRGAKMGQNASTR